MACASFEEWWGERPRQEDYMPEFPQGTATHFQMYEETSEGTPISPVCATIEELALWLVDNRASAMAGMPATYEEWLAMCRASSSVGSVAFVDGEALSGVVAVVSAILAGFGIAEQKGAETIVHLLPAFLREPHIDAASVRRIRHPLDDTLLLHHRQAATARHLRCFRCEPQARQRCLQPLAFTPIEVEKHLASRI